MHLRLRKKDRAEIRPVTTLLVTELTALTLLRLCRRRGSALLAARGIRHGTAIARCGISVGICAPTIRAGGVAVLLRIRRARVGSRLPTGGIGVLPPVSVRRRVTTGVSRIRRLA